MEKELTIIIPHFRETEQELFPLLASIGMQCGIDLNTICVIIVNDGLMSKRISQEFLDSFNFEVKQLTLAENRGPGVARQEGLDEATTPFVMFCDGDDCLHNCGVLDAMMTEAKSDKKPDIVKTNWLEEIMDSKLGRVKYTTHKAENTWMHGKIFRKDFLTEKGIRFHRDLRVHEDSYFLCIAAAATNNVSILGITSYVWKHHESSITRSDHASYSFVSIPTFLEACTMAHKEIERINPEQIHYKTAQLSFYIYFMMHSARWLKPEHDEHRKDAEEAFVRYMKPFWHHWKDMSADFVGQVYNNERSKHADKKFVETETFKAWVQRLGLE